MPFTTHPNLNIQEVHSPIEILEKFLALSSHLVVFFPP
ncbi:MAG: hypothetical protein JETT_1494 [Candidatus Jettenia ecosi]|uniref:Uncharacterized protein n=1 Tax=Candidatus Jettenia ecosi TaxID=2494326 RepID=A0A533QHU1_9BACT|nr:MAG: hypothetical protein JETT_1494 [Candidatus Jettenia ecosi]